jgi:hypothetical protein
VPSLFKALWGRTAGRLQGAGHPVSGFWARVWMRFERRGRVT